MASKRELKDFKKGMNRIEEKCKTSFKYVYEKIDQFQKGIEYLGSENMARKDELQTLKMQLEEVGKEIEKLKKKTMSTKRI